MVSTVEDKEGNIWYATEKRGLFRIKTDSTITVFTEENGLPSDYFYCILEDNSNNIWFGTDGSGIGFYASEIFTHLTKQEGLPTNLITAIKEDNNGNVWYGSDNGIVIKTDSTNIYFTEENGLPDKNIQRFYLNKENEIFATTSGGLAWFTDYKIHVSDIPELQDEIFDIEQTYFGNYLIATHRNLFSMSENKDSVKRVPRFNGSYINDIFIDSENNTWISTSLAFYKCNEFDTLKFTSKSKIGGFYQSAEDKYGNIWCAYNNGLFIVTKDNKVIEYSTKEGITSITLYFIHSYLGNMWLGTENGLDRIFYNENLEIDSVRNYTEYDGFTGIECNAWASEVLKNGKLAMGTINGATFYNPKYDDINKTPPKVHITNIRLLYEKINWGKKYPELTLKNNLPVNPKFKTKDNHITFDFIGIDYSNNGNTRYKFMLEGYDNDWSPATKQTFASYPYLNPGTYTFKVMAENKFGFWSEAKEYTFTITVPFWQKTWFIVLATLIIGSLLYFLMIARTRSLAKSKRILEERVRLRTQELLGKNKELELLSLAASEMKDGVIVCKPNGEFVWYNDGFFKMAGYSNKEEFVTEVFEHYDTIFELSSNIEIEEIFQNFKSNNSPIVYESHHYVKTGEKIWTSATLTPIYNKEELSYVVALYSDVSEKKYFIDSLQNKNSELEKLSLVVRKMNEAVIICNAEGIIEYYNHGMIRNSGFSEQEFEEMLGKEKKIQSLSSYKGINQVLQDFHKCKDTFFYDSYHDKKDGGVMWTTASLTPIYKNDLLDKVIFVYTDITDRKMFSEKLKQQHKDITDSIEYAKNIQRAILPNRNILNNNLSDSMVYYKPRDIVSGDFYWFSKINNVLIIVAADCTGHGVPGAFMSMIGNEFLHQIINSKQVSSPKEALIQLDKRMSNALSDKNAQTQRKDGMDIAMLAIDLNTNEAQFCGAFNPLYLIRDNEIIEYKSVKESIGGGVTKEDSFILHDIQLEANDKIYLFSDGYIDQFGGEKGKKFMRRRFKQMLLDIHQKPMEEQYKEIDKTFLTWKGERNQVDDILIIGLGVNELS